VRHLIGGVTVLGLVLAGCSKSSTAPGTAHTLTVSIRDDSFSPAVDSISAGDTVTWSWQGSQLHDLTFADSIGNVAAQSSGTTKRVFPSVGIYKYRCQLHSTSFTSGMIGTIAVY
jgi:plastocyanin